MELLLRTTSMAVNPPLLIGAFKLLKAVAMVLIIVCCVEGGATRAIS